MAEWTKKVNPQLKPYLEKTIKTSAEHKKAIELASNKNVAQLWVANALLYRELQEAKTRLKYLETLLIDTFEKNPKKNKETKDLIKTMKKL